MTFATKTEQKRLIDENPGANYDLIFCADGAVKFRFKNAINTKSMPFLSRNTWRNVVEEWRLYADFTLTTIDASGHIVSQENGYIAADQHKLPPFAGPGARYFHRSDNDIQDKLRKLSKAPKFKHWGPTPMRVSVTDKDRAKLIAQLTADPGVTCA